MIQTPATHIPGRPRAAAFTLVELLVVISVIAVLIGLLIPTLAGARDTAQQSACAANLRQFGLAALAHANDNRGDMCTGPFDNRVRASYGAINEKGWVADYRNFDYAQPAKMLCPSNPAEYSQNLELSRLNDDGWGAFGVDGASHTPETQRRLVEEGYNTNYTQAWYMAYTGVKDNNNAIGYDSKRVSGVVGPLNVKYLSAQVSDSRVPLIADARTDTDDTFEFGPDAERVRAVKALTDGPTRASSRLYGMQDYKDWGPAHGKSSFIAIGNKGHDKVYGNIVFADAHVSSFRDVNRDGEFGHDLVATPGGRANKYHDLGRDVFGGWLNQLDNFILPEESSD